MIKFFPFLFFYFVSLNADQISLNENKINQKKDQEHIFGYRECCGNNVFWCKSGFNQSSDLMVSFLVIFISALYFRFNRQGEGGEFILTMAPSSLQCITIATSALLYPYFKRYKLRGHLKPTCYKTAFLSPLFFIEVPYFFYQNRKNKKSDVPLLLFN